MNELLDAQRPMLTRAQMWNRVAATTRFDLVVIGGGSTGLGVALDAALRGYSVALFESHDFASGTSSRSTKLLHGGVRYLAQGNVALVREALAERATVLHSAPHLAQPLAFVMPAYHWWQRPFYGIGLKLYDALAAWGSGGGLGATEFLSREETLRRLPGVNPKGLQGGVQYWDAQFDDARLAVALARSAADAGAVVLNHCAVTGLLHSDAKNAVVQIAGVNVRDHVSGQTLAVRARCVVNATGVWVDDVRQMEAAGAIDRAQGSPMLHTADQQPMVSPSQGVHLVVDRSFMPASRALLVPKTRDGRVLFAVPWMGRVILGTTDTPRQDRPREPQPLEAEINFILDEASIALSKPVTRADVKSVWVGLRPLVRPPSQDAGQHTRTVSREHTIVQSERGLVTVTGGKWTTYRAMAQDVIERCLEWGSLNQPPKPTQAVTGTPKVRLAGAPKGTLPIEATPIWQPPGTHLYGSDATSLERLPGHDQWLAPGLSEAMVRFAVQSEFALTVEDVLARRSRLLFLDASLARQVAPRVADILREESGHDPELDAFLALCRLYQGAWNSN